jgi:hypothetical protein
MSRPESCVGLAGGSPAAVSAGAPRSRPRAWGEISRPERGVKSPQGAVGHLGGEQGDGPSIKRTLQPREIGAERRSGRADHVAAKATDCTTESGWVQDAPGVGGRARRHSPIWNRRGPTRPPTSGKDLPYKPSAKGAGAGRESEGLVVPTRAATTTRPKGRGPALVRLARGGKCEGMGR